MGYRIAGHRLVPDERFAPIILEVYTRYGSGETLADISADLNARGYRTRRGREFTTGTFDRIIPNPAYIGQYQYGGVTVPDLCPAIAASLAANRDVVLRAPPGSGKTTCVPPFLLDAPWLAGKKILMLEPRRLAARGAAA